MVFAHRRLTRLVGVFEQIFLANDKVKLKGRFQLNDTSSTDSSPLRFIEIL